jgi:hypothetical protein
MAPQIASAPTNPPIAPPNAPQRITFEKWAFSMSKGVRNVVSPTYYVRSRHCDDQDGQHILAKFGCQETDCAIYSKNFISLTHCERIDIHHNQNQNEIKQIFVI